MNKQTKRIVIVGASSGMGQKCAEILAQKGHKVAIAARRTEELQKIQSKYRNNVVYLPIDITKEDADKQLMNLIELNGGMDMYFHASGIGFHNTELQQEKELSTVEVNVKGFVRMITAAFSYYRDNHIRGQIVCITSIAGTKGLGAAPSYSSSKRFQNTYIQSLDQLSQMNDLGITFTDIRPGFVKTALLDSQKKYPLLMDADYVSRQIISAVEKKRRVKIIDIRYAFITFFWRIIPNCLWRILPVKN